MKQTDPLLQKSVSDSAVEMTELVLPNDTNLLNNLLGGRLMHWMDVAAGMVGSRHANRVVVTAAVDNLLFHHPIHLGELVNIKARISWTGHSSMEILVHVTAENALTGQKRLANEAFFTFVALDDAGSPTPVPGLRLETDEEETLYRQAKERRRIRLQLKKQKKLL
ncbi:MAG: acyl-CoA thioesterase [Calditrichales bacterium]|nr:MAG: acyl-CoA thioesterase [Calditrichales bacterium]